MDNKSKFKTNMLRFVKWHRKKSYCATSRSW